MCHDRLKMRVFGEKETVLAVFGAFGLFLTNHRLHRLMHRDSTKARRVSDSADSYY